MLRTAIRCARRSEHRWALHAAIIYRGGVALATGFNFGEIHAECDAIHNFKRRHPEDRMQRLKMLVIRLSRTGELRISRPCEHCQRVLKAHNIRNVMYSTREGTLERMRL